VPGIPAFRPPGRLPLRAVCPGGALGFRRLPAIRCVWVTDESKVVIGVVAGWGRAFRGQFGWRTQFARPVALYRAPHVDREQLDRIVRRYGCLVVAGRGDLRTLVDQRA
jgi:hypothetical protein